MNIVWQIVGYAGPVVVMAGFIWFMIAKQGWRLAQVFAGGLMGLLLVSSVPQLPNAVHDGFQGVIDAIRNAE